MKIVTVVGARPQFVKAAAFSRVYRKRGTEVLVHTGQHYDNNMSALLFEELEIPEPDYNLGVGSASHARQTAVIMVGVEDIPLKEKPHFLVVYGDTNSTLAAALAASKLNIPVAHIESGLRSFNMKMPEEQNRILTDRISTLLFCPTQTAVDNLYDEGIKTNVHVVGDVMCDAIRFYSERALGRSKDEVFASLEGLFGELEAYPKEWYLATIHRAENTADESKLEQVLAAFEELDASVIFPVHPRTKEIAGSLIKKHGYKNIIFTQPIGYCEMLFLLENAKKMITDSGGIQKEAYILKTPCVTVREQTEWVETLEGNWNILAKPDSEDILKKTLETAVDFTKHKTLYGDGFACERIVETLMKAT